jgi:O-antigen biosynthesis protein
MATRGIRDPSASAGLHGGGDGKFTPITVLDIDLSERLPTLYFGTERQRVWLLARLYGDPVGAFLFEVEAQGLTAEALGDRLWRDIGTEVTRRYADAGVSAPCGIPALGLGMAAARLSEKRSGAPESDPLISVVVCTRDRPGLLQNCISHLDLQQYAHFEVIVVDNAPAGDEARQITRNQARRRPYRYVVEPRPGLSWARNAGVSVAVGDIVAFLDDDDEADPRWLAGIARGFARGQRVGCVTGSVLPARLDTAAQELFEQLGGHRKGRGFAQMMFSRSGPQNPLFPLPPFGAGANMAFTREALAAIGGFDVALGAGTPTAACEDTLAMTLTLLAGYELAYEPSAVMWHHHRRDMEGLQRQLHGYSIGLTAFYAALVRHRPMAVFGLLKLIPAAAKYLHSATHADSPASGTLEAHLQRRHFLGLLAGPAAYVRSVLVQRRLDSMGMRRTEKELGLQP